MYLCSHVPSWGKEWVSLVPGPFWDVDKPGPRSLVEVDGHVQGGGYPPLLAPCGDHHTYNGQRSGTHPTRMHSSFQNKFDVRHE